MFFQVDGRIALNSMASIPFFLVAALLLTGCRPTNNHRVFRKGQVTARARLERGKATYRYLEMLFPKQENSQLDDFVIRLPKGQLLRISDLTLEILQENCHYVTDYSVLYPSRKDDKKIFYVGGYSFDVMAGRITKITASTVTLESSIRLGKLSGGWEANVPKIGRYGEKKLYEMPLSHDEVIGLFGPPDSVRDGYRQ